MKWGEETLTLETGKVARQADGTVIATLGETSVMANVTFAKEMKEGFECGIGVDSFSKFKEGDIIICYEIKSIKRTLELN